MSWLRNRSLLFKMLTGGLSAIRGNRFAGNDLGKLFLEDELDTERYNQPDCVRQDRVKISDPCENYSQRFRSG